MDTIDELIKSGDELFARIIIPGEINWEKEGANIPDDAYPEEGGPDEFADEEDELRPTEAMAANAQAAIEAMRHKGLVARTLSAVAMHRARQIADRVALPASTIEKMKAYFSRIDPETVQAAKADEGKAWIEWNAWGGDAAKEWIETQ
jgi:hypothetical protein